MELTDKLMLELYPVERLSFTEFIDLCFSQVLNFFPHSYIVDLPCSVDNLALYRAFTDAAESLGFARHIVSVLGRRYRHYPDPVDDIYNNDHIEFRLSRGFTKFTALYLNSGSSDFYLVQQPYFFSLCSGSTLDKFVLNVHEHIMCELEVESYLGLMPGRISELLNNSNRLSCY